MKSDCHDNHWYTVGTIKEARWEESAQLQQTKVMVEAGGMRQVTTQY